MYGLVAQNALLAAIALLLGGAAALFSSRFDFTYVLIGGVAAAALVIAANRRAVLWFTLIAGLVLIGIAQIYLPGSKYIKYVAPLAAAGLFVHVMAAWMRSAPRNLPSTVPLFGLFFFIGLLSIALNWQGFAAALWGFKNYYPMWALFLGLTVMSWDSRTIDSIPKLLMWVAVLQIPFVLHQYLYLVPMRIALQEPGLVPVDVVSGTFGGRVAGGGANAVLSLFLITVAACVAGLWREGVVRTGVAIAAIAVLVLPIFVNGSRVSIFYLPLVFFIVLGSQIRRQPVRALVGLLVTVGLVIGLVTSYATLKPGVSTWQEWFEDTIDRQFESELERPDNAPGLTRWSVLTFWAKEQSLQNVGHLLLGHGPGAAQVEESGLNESFETLAEGKYGGRNIGYTAVASLLWEVGVLGLASVLALFVAAFFQARVLRVRYAVRDPARAGLARGLSAAMVVFAISLAHKDFFVYHIPFQTLLVCLLGYLGAQINITQSQLAESTDALSPVQQ